MGFSKEILKRWVIPNGRKFAVESTETLSFVKAFENWVFYKKKTEKWLLKENHDFA